ncbi:LytR/AlgR family response regulator transcription factor [Dinghuibacter silviterrae]|uniref:LytTR family two component transcriptional regulator n=1 Tax=Dinghuibacter silviterrae TaxID=1539049 RepID=A0A4R8DGQ9_9BACT|nr:LytTR family DNA-binding domain-containing protein [Dinghuibacter silviterrae]TDW96853.1 LytTR family two component transcriptional regulator [Dinghuibacter silviterrae]
MTLTAVLIDDEQNNLDNLGHLLGAYCPEVTVTGTALSAKEGRLLLERVRPDLLFLDIQMPGETGLDLLRSLHTYSFDVIFVTAHDQYGIQAVKFSALDYLLKPIHIDELRTAVDKAIQRRGHPQGQLENLVHLLRQQHREDHRIALTTLKETRFVPVRQVIRLESTNNYSHFYLAGEERLTTSRAIHEYEDMLRDYGFIRCHQSHLVNQRFVRSWVKDDGGYLLLDDGTQVPVSRNKKSAVAAALHR